VLDGSSRMVANREVKLRARNRGLSVRDYVRESADPTLTTVYLEDTADVIGAALALIGLILHRVAGWSAADALASVGIGCLLVYIATRRASRNRDLLTNQAVPPRYTDEVRAMMLSDDDVAEVPELQVIYLGPHEVLVTGAVKLVDGLDRDGVVDALARVRDRIGARYPQVGHWYLTPVR
jgi:divalent metal cation (Fe/Co/Zn/Cd) transporter